MILNHFIKIKQMAIFILSSEIDKQKAKTRFEFFLSNEKTIELTEKKQKRSNRQNSYLHMLLSYFGLEYGETMQYVKEHFFKKTVNHDIFVYERVNQKTGEVRKALRSSADLDSRELTIAIEKFRNWSAQTAGVYLPAPDEQRFLEQIERDLEMYNNRLYI